MNDWLIWGIRFAISLAATAVLAWGISFQVADYVVRANTSSANEAMHTLQSSLDRLNETMIVNNARLDQMNALITGLVADSAVQATEIAAMRDDVGNLQLAVERHGIDIKASFGKLGLDALDWQSLRDDLEIPKGTSVLWKMTPIYDPEK